MLKNQKLHPDTRISTLNNMHFDSCLLLIFTRNPELGKCKTRLASRVGDAAALDIYKFLLRHTVRLTQTLEVAKWVYYSDIVCEEDMWSRTHYTKKSQCGVGLGQRMYHAFEQGFAAGYQKVIIIGSDMYHLSQEDLKNAFAALNKNDYVIGPAQDGGYYLLGMKSLNKALFENKAWGTSTVLRDTLKDLTGEKQHLLPVRNDIDHYEDLKDIQVFQPFIKHMKK